MKKKILIGIFAAAVLGLLVVCIGRRICNYQDKHTIPFCYSISHNQDYIVNIYAESGVGLLNVPTYITIEGIYQKTEKVVAQVDTKIDNNNSNIEVEMNIWTFWEDNRNICIVLLGKEQVPEIIKIEFDGNNQAEVSQIYSSDLARKLLNEI